MSIWRRIESSLSSTNGVTGMIPALLIDGVDRAELALGLVEEGLEGGAVGDVELERDGAAAEPRRRLLGQVEIDVADRDPEPLGEPAPSRSPCRSRERRR